MADNGIPKEYRNEPVTVFDVIRQNLKNSFAQQSHVEPFAKPIDRNITTVGTGQLTVTVLPQQLSYVSRNKTAVKITNLSATVDVYWSTIGGLVAGDLGNGDLLPAGRGNWVSIPSPSIIWVAVAPGSGTARISWAEAYDD
jgi:hypothetical protein